MSNIKTVTSILREPFCDNTRKTRRNLLIVSLTGILISKVGLIPQEISIFSIKLNTNHQESLVLLLVAIVVFYFFSFITYFLNDYIAGALDAENSEYELRKKLKARESNNNSKDDIDIKPSTSQHVKFGLYMRVTIDIIVPLIFASYTFYSLIKFKASM